MKDFEEELLYIRITNCCFFSIGMDMSRGTLLGKRPVFDYELEIIIDSDQGKMQLDDHIIPVNKGDILFRKPGETTEGIMKYNSIFICFNTSKEISAEFLSFIERLPVHVVHSKKDVCERIFMDIFNHHLNPKKGSTILIQSLLLKLIYLIFIDQEGNSLMDTQNTIINEAVQYVHYNLGKDLSLVALSKVCKLSPTYFHQQFVEYIGITPCQYVTIQRVKGAKEYLVHTAKSLNEISQLMGFHSSSYFSYIFKKHTSMTPTAYRKQHGNGATN